MTQAETDAGFLRRAIALAMRGRGQVEPNPMVGCLIVREGQVLGEGYHGRVGGPHAEPTAIADCAARGNSPRGSTAYVTLEPCCHTNKRTPPCVPSVIAAGISRVVIGCLDPNPEVNGRGVRLLREAGIEVTTGVCEAEARQLLAPFTALTRLGRPYITVKWAQSAEGYIAGPDGARRQISGPTSSAIVQQLRARCEAILVGGKTVRKDDPLLTVRGVSPSRQRLRVVVTSAELPLASKLLNSQDAGEVLVWRPSNGSLPDLMSELARRGVAHLLVESGGRLAQSLESQGLVDRAWVIRSSRPLGEPGIKAIQLEWEQVGSANLADDEFIEMLNPASPLYFAGVKSADFLQQVESPV